MENLILNKYLKELKTTEFENRNYYKLVPFVARIFADNNEDLKELISIGNLAITEALDSYKPDLNTLIEALLVEYCYYLSMKKDFVSIYNKDLNLSYVNNNDMKTDTLKILENLYDFEREYILYKYGFYDGQMHTKNECYNEFAIEKDFGNLFENKLMKKTRKIYFE